MSFIAKHIVANHERLIGVARIHWIHLIKGMFWALIILGIGATLYRSMMGLIPSGLAEAPFILMGYHLGFPSTWTAGIFSATAAGIFLIYALQYLSTEVGLTSHRVIRKTGLIAVETMEIELNEIEAAQIHHGLLGQFLDYGGVALDCRLVGDLRLPTIRHPYRFLNALHKAQAQAGHEKTPIHKGSSPV